MVSRPVFQAHGPVGELFEWITGDVPAPMEAVVEGSAGSSKTRPILEWCRHMAMRFPNTKGLIMRETRVSMNESTLDSWENEVLGATHPMVMGRTREHRDKYTFANGSEIVLGGFDNPTRLFSTQYNWIYFNEAQETTKEKWESLHRALRRKGTPFRVLIGDCNPEHYDHWLNIRCGVPGYPAIARRITTRLWNNPVYFKDGEWTPDGADYYKRLSSSLTGVRRERLFEGKWVSAEGMVLDTYDPARHLITARVFDENGTWFIQRTDGQRIRLAWFIGSMDIGTVAPGCFQVWGVDDAGKMYRVAEIYRTGWTDEDWAERIVEVRFPLMTIVCDHDPSFILTLNRWLARKGKGQMAREADKTLGRKGTDGKRASIDLLRTGFRDDEVFLVRDVNTHIDMDRRKSGRAWCGEMEMPAVTYRPHVPGEDPSGKADEVDPTCDDHAFDSTRYARNFVFMRNVERKKLAPQFAPGTFGHTFKHQEWMRAQKRA